MLCVERYVLTSESDAPLPFEPEFVAAELVVGDEELGAGASDEVDEGLGAGVSEEVELVNVGVGTGVELDVVLVEIEVEDEDVIGVLETVDAKTEVLEGANVVVEALEVVDVLIVVIERVTGVLEDSTKVEVNVGSVVASDVAIELDALVVTDPPPKTMLSDVELADASAPAALYNTIKQ